MIKPLIAAASGRAVMPPPVWLMRQAGRHLPEYRAVRERAGSFLGLCLNPELAAEVTLQPVRRYGVDGAIIFADILLVPWLLGQELTFVEGEGPRLSPALEFPARRVESPGYRYDGLLDRVAPVMETLRRVRADLPEKTALIGFAGGPWTVACYMVSPRAGADSNAAVRFAYQAPEQFDALLDTLVTVTTDYLIAQIDAGAEIVQLFESWAGALSADLFERCCIGPTQRIVAALRKYDSGVPVIGFPRGAGAWIARYARETGVGAVGIDSLTSLAWARDALGRETCLQGNIDPLLLVTGGAALRTAVADRIAAQRGMPYIVNLGHGVLPETPPEHVAELVACVRKHAG